MEIRKSEARSKTLFAVAWLQSNNDEVTAKTVAEQTGYDASNASRYCNNWEKQGLLYKDKEGRKVTFGINKRELVKLLFEHISNQISDELGYSEFPEHIKDLDEDDAQDFLDDQGFNMPMAEHIDHQVIAKRDMVQYFWEQKIDLDSPFAEELANQIIAHFKQASQPVMEITSDVFGEMKQYLDKQTVEVLEHVMPLAEAFEEPVRKAETVHEALEESINQMCFNFEFEHAETDEAQRFQENLKTFRTGNII